ncbi:hypothetical protein SDC9_168566 [bioreactor metagenome]|uniref:Uncharacterized protein n=1 Tax=bioreactor metagenome TaxID=1076179 RepID=A0A645G2U0_9ZZZZ
MKQGEVLHTYTVVIYGDLTGDCIFDEMDIVILNLYISYSLAPSEDILNGTPRFIAGALNQDDVLDELDKSLQNNILAYFGKMNQVTGVYVVY